MVPRYVSAVPARTKRKNRKGNGKGKSKKQREREKKSSRKRRKLENFARKEVGAPQVANAKLLEKHPIPETDVVPAVVSRHDLPRTKPGWSAPSLKDRSEGEVEPKTLRELLAQGVQLIEWDGEYVQLFAAGRFRAH